LFIVSAERDKPDIREKIFNLFFTTKPTGQGTGLGLSISYDIIVPPRRDRGEIKVETEEGKFTEFVVRLPRKTWAKRLRREITT
jgi:two-component system NtrC family sensor kinase